MVISPGGTLWALALDFEGTQVHTRALTHTPRARAHTHTSLLVGSASSQRHLRNDGGSLFSLGNKMGEIQVC